MADRPGRSTHFETITGQSTVTDHQQIDIPVRYDDRREETDISDSLDTTAKARGFPEPSPHEYVSAVKVSQSVGSILGRFAGIGRRST